MSIDFPTTQEILASPGELESTSKRWAAALSNVGVDLNELTRRAVLASLATNSLDEEPDLKTSNAPIKSVSDITEFRRSLVSGAIGEAVERAAPAFASARFPNFERVKDTLRNHLFALVLPLLRQSTILEWRLAKGVSSSANPDLKLLNSAKANFFAKYPVIRRLCAFRIANATDAAIELAGRIVADDRHLDAVFNLRASKLKAVDWAAGDLHRRGRQVAILTFYDGRTLVYKPRSLRIDEGVFNAITAFSEAAGFPPLSPPIQLDQISHGYVEHVEQRPAGNISQVEAFFLGAGALLATCVILGISDLHYENLIAQGNQLLPVDLEASLEPHSFKGDFVDARKGKQFESLQQSLFRCGLLPQRTLLGKTILDIAGLSAPDKIGFHLDRSAISEAQAELKNLALVREKMMLSKHRLKYAGNIVEPSDHLREILDGFDRLMRWATESWTKITAIADSVFANIGHEGRWVARSTADYARMIGSLCHPQLAASPSNADAFLVSSLLCAPVHRVDVIVGSERRQLLRGDVPYFLTAPHSRLVHDGDGPVGEAFSMSGMDTLKARAAALHQTRTFHRNTISLSIASTQRAVAPKKWTPSVNELLTRKAALDEAGFIADRLITQCLKTKSGMQWITLKPILLEEQTAMIGSNDLYDGAAGILLALSLLQTVRPTARRARLCEALKNQTVIELSDPQKGMDIGAFEGLAGQAFALEYCAVLSHSEAAYDRTRVFRQLAQMAKTDERLDCIGGVAGVLWVCARIFIRMSKPEEVAAITACATACKDRLVETAREKGQSLYWLTLPDFKDGLSGLAHGSAGMAMALASWSEVSNDSAVAKIALRALQFEIARYDSSSEQWIDERTGLPSLHWCYGPAGVFIAAEAVARVVRDPAVIRLRDHARAAVRVSPSDGADILCHGSLGNLDIIAKDIGLMRRLFSSIVARRRAEGRWRSGLPLDVDNPGLMTGVAGIVYALCRYASAYGHGGLLKLELPTRVHKMAQGSICDCRL